MGVVMGGCLGVLCRDFCGDVHGFRGKNGIRKTKKKPYS